MPDPLTSREVAQARADAEELLPDACTITRKASVSDGGGGQTETWQPVATDVPCRLAAASVGGDRRIADRLQDTTTHIVTFAAGFDVRTEDRITIGPAVYVVVVVHSAGGLELTRPVEARIAVQEVV